MGTPSIHVRRIANNLRIGRHRQGWTQQQVADALHLSRTTVVAIEQGKRELSLLEASRLEQCTGITVAALLSSP